MTAGYVRSTLGDMETKPTSIRIPADVRDILARRMREWRTKLAPTLARIVREDDDRRRRKT